MQIVQLIDGCVLIIIGSVVIIKRKELIRGLLLTQKKIDRSLNFKDKNYNHIGFTVIPELIFKKKRGQVCY